MQSLVVQGISKGYGATLVLNNVSLAVMQGEIFGLLGPNGAGKSTLIKILTGFESPNSGNFSYFLNGKPLPKKVVKEKVAVIPQDLCFYSGFSVEQNLSIMASLYNLHGQKARANINAALAYWGLNDFRKKKAEFLSGGYKRLLNIACGMVNDPSIIFLDEPTVGLDPKIRIDFWQKISELKNLGKTIILTTHYMEEAERLCDSIALIVSGRIAAHLSVSELKKRNLSVESVFLRLVSEKGIMREDI